jgi:hypothetical protein
MSTVRFWPGLYSVKLKFLGVTLPVLAKSTYGAVGSAWTVTLYHPTGLHFKPLLCIGQPELTEREKKWVRRIVLRWLGKDGEIQNGDQNICS